jgi:hypothetical protein
MSDLDHGPEEGLAAALTSILANARERWRHEAPAMAELPALCIGGRCAGRRLALTTSADGLPPRRIWVKHVQHGLLRSRAWNVLYQRVDIDELARVWRYEPVAGEPEREG